jgi:hypothetical protein
MQPPSTDMIRRPVTTLSAQPHPARRRAASSLCRRLIRAPLLAAIAIAAVFAGAGAASATPSAVGYDLSFPQCENPPPASASFVIVGVDGGLANNPNPCLAQQLAWAAGAPGLQRPAVPGLSLYLNAADPGSRVADWPSPAAGTATVATPYGSCNGSWSRACAFLYATQRASYSYALAVAAAAPATSLGSTPGPASAPTAQSPALPAAATAPWWIDVEIGASWASRASAREWAALNMAALRGYVAGLRAAGARGPVGLYSNAYQWRAITGLGPRASRGHFPLAEHDWATGSTTLAQARRACAKPFSGSAVTIAQFSEGGYDRDYACPR